MPINDPIAWWRLDDGSGSTAVDSSGNGYTLTLSNTPTWITPAQIGGGLRFDGALSQKGETSAAGLLASLQGENSFTVAFWSRASQYDLSKAAFAIRNGVDITQLLTIYPYDTFNGDGARVFWNNVGAGFIIDQNAGAVAVNTWNHFLFVSRSATDHEMYVNNVSVGTSTDNISLSGTLSHITIGAWNGGQFFSGDMDDVRIYNRALSNAERAELFAWRSDQPPVRVDSISGGSSPAGRRKQQQLPWWWYSYFDEQPESEEQRKARAARKALDAAEERRLRRLELAAERAEEARRQAELAAARAKAEAQLSASLAAAKAALEEKQAAFNARVDGALGGAQAKRGAAEREREEDERRRMRQVVRSRRPFAKRFETAVELMKRQGWRARN